MIDIGTVNVTGGIDAADIKRIGRLFSTQQGTVPLDRNFGVDTSSIDSVQDAVDGRLMVEYCRALLLYFPTYQIADISFKVDGGKVLPTVVIGYA